MRRRQVTVHLLDGPSISWVELSRCRPCPLRWRGARYRVSIALTRRQQPGSPRAVPSSTLLDEAEEMYESRPQVRHGLGLADALCCPGGRARPQRRHDRHGPPALCHAGRLGGAGSTAVMFSGARTGGGARPDV